MNVCTFKSEFHHLPEIHINTKLASKKFRSYQGNEINEMYAGLGQPEGGYIFG